MTTRQTPQRAPEDAVSDSVDLGRGPVAAASPDGGYAARRSLFGLRRESLHGFAPDTGATVEILGARTAGQFLLSSLESVDVAAVAAALRESIPRNGTEFAWLDDAAVGTAPPKATLPPRVDADRDRAFAASGLTAPQVLSAADAAAGRHWLQVQGSVEGYRPGSTVYLAVTSDPLLVAEAVVDRRGRAQVTGSFPLEVVGAGGHSIRLIGTRSLNGVTVDESGQVRLARTTLTEIRRFDAGTHATVTVVGVNATGGGHTAVRIVPLDLRPPWWTLLVVIVVALTAAVARRRRRLGTRRRLLVASAVIIAASAPALVLGWFAITYAVMGWGALLGVLGVAVLRVVPQRRRTDDEDGTADTAGPAPREPRWLVTSGAGSVD